MKQFRHRFLKTASLCLVSLSLVVSLLNAPAAAIQNPVSGSIGLEGKIPAPAPTQAATITTPSNGQVFTQIPIQISGLCPKGLLVKVFSNNIFIGSAQCTNGSYSIQASLFSGRNDLIARVYDALGQAGPDSNMVSVTFNDAQFIQFGTHVFLTSNYAERGANPGQELTWPVILSGGIGPYAISVDWGDGKSPDLMSEPFPGTITLKHVYDSAGVYNIIVKASDSKGTAAFLQLVGVGNGQATQAKAGQGSSSTITKTVVLWWPAAAMLPLILIAFWLGKRYELFVLRRNIEKSHGA